MPILFQTVVRREDLIRNRQVLYVFPDNLRRKGGAGIAKEARREPNAHGIATRYSVFEPFLDAPAAVVAQQRSLDKDFKALFAQVAAGKIVVWPVAPLDPDMARYAPRTADYLRMKVRALFAAAGLFETPEKETANEPL